MINHRIIIFYHCPAFLRERGLNDTIAREYIRRVVLPSPQKILSKRKKKKDKKKKKRPSGSAAIPHWPEEEPSPLQRPASRSQENRRRPITPRHPTPHCHDISFSALVDHTVLYFTPLLFCYSPDPLHSTPPPSNPTRCVSLFLSLAFSQSTPEYIRRRHGR